MQQAPILGESQPRPESSDAAEQAPGPAAPATVATETGGRDGPGVNGSGMNRLDPTRYGDWERNGRCIDF